MKKIIKLTLLTAAIISNNQLQAEYLVIYQLDPNGIIMEKMAINGNATLNPNTINRGESSTISWNYDYANEVEIQGLGVYGKSGTLNITPLATRSYTITAKYGSLIKKEDLTLTVIQPNSNISFSSNLNKIGIGQSVILNWNISNAKNIEIDNGIGNGLPLIGSTEVYPTTDTTFTLSGFDFSDNPIISSVFVNVVPNSIINSFNASELNITTGGNINFNWNVSDSDNLNLIPYGPVSGSPTGVQDIVFNTAGSFDFYLESTSLNGTIVESSPINVNVYNPAIISNYTINGVDTTSDVSPNDTLNFEWAATDAINYKLNGNSVSGNTTSLTAASTTGTTNYVLEAFNGAGDSVTKSLSVNVVGLPVINTFTGPNTVFTKSPLTLSWTGTGVSKYEIKSNNATSGIATTAIDLGSALNTNTTPTAAGSYTYTLSGYNTANTKVDLTKSVVVEADPIFTGFTVNGQTSISVSPSTALTFAGAGFSTGATLQGRNSGNTADANLPPLAPATGGTYTYYAAATKALNSISKYSTVRAVTVIVENWVAATPTYTAWINSGALYGCTWTPDPSTVNSGVSFTQNATNCSQDQTRNRQNREQESTTLVIRNSGSVIVENQTLTNQSSSRTSTGTQLETVGCRFSENPTYDPNGETSQWSEYIDIFTSQNIFYMNQKIWPTGDDYVIFQPIFTSYNYNGYRYTRGSLIKTDGSSKYYKVCKTKI